MVTGMIFNTEKYNHKWGSKVSFLIELIALGK